MKTIMNKILLVTLGVSMVSAPVEAGWFDKVSMPNVNISSKAGGIGAFVAAVGVLTYVAFKRKSPVVETATVVKAVPVDKTAPVAKAVPVDKTASVTKVAPEVLRKAIRDKDIATIENLKSQGKLSPRQISVLKAQSLLA